MAKVSKEGLTPMMKQFYDLKAKHPDALLLFRCGDFYETYADDAVIASSILGITLTRRNNGKETMPNTEMAGFPHHALDTYLPKLVRAGKRVAICDQLEDPKLTKTLVKRGIGCHTLWKDFLRIGLSGYQYRRVPYHRRHNGLCGKTFRQFRPQGGSLRAR